MNKKFMVTKCHKQHSVFEGNFIMSLADTNGLFSKPLLFDTFEEAEIEIEKLLTDSWFGADSVTYSICQIYYNGDSPNLNKKW